MKVRSGLGKPTDQGNRKPDSPEELDKKTSSEAVDWDIVDPPRKGGRHVKMQNLGER